MEIYLKTLTPLHIGTGEDLQTMDYVVHQGTYYRVNQNQFLDFLARHPSQSDAFGDWIFDYLDDLREVEQSRTLRGRPLDRDFNQTRRDLREGFNLLNFCKKEGIEQEFLRYLQDPAHVIKAYPVETHSRQPKQQVRGLITTGLDGLPYLPGTSLKGAIRTALLYCALEDHGQQYEPAILDDIYQNLQSGDRPSAVKKKIGQQVEWSLCYCSMEDDRGRRKDNEERFDLFKFLSVQDAHLLDESGSRVAVVASDLYLVNLQKERNGNTRKLASRQPQSPSLEVINSQTSFQCQVRLDVAGMRQIVARPNPNEWIGMPQKVQQLYGIDLQSSVSTEALQQQAEDHLHQCLTRFARAQLAFESRWLENQMLAATWDLRIRPNEFKAQFGALFEYPFKGRTLMRTGYGTGFADKTILMYIHGREPLRKAFEKVMAKFQIGARPGMKGRYTPSLEKFPKSRTLITYSHSVSSLGWLEWIPRDDWKGAAEMTESRSQAQTSRSQSTPPPTPQKIVPQYFQGKLRVGALIDAYVFPQSNTHKLFHLYISKEQQPRLPSRYPADAIVGKIVLVEVTAMNGEEVSAIKFKKLKTENR